MERRLLLGIVLMVGVMILSNVLFPPVEVPVETPAETGAAGEGGPQNDAPATPETGGDAAAAGMQQEAALTEAEETARRMAEALAETDDLPAGLPDAAESPSDAGAGDIVAVRSELYEYRFDTRGARLVGATMLQHDNFSEVGHAGRHVELIRPGDAAFDYSLSFRGDTISLSALTFRASAPELEVAGEPAELRFDAEIGAVTFDITYRFHPDDYRIEVSGGLRGREDVGHAILVGLGRGIERNEAVLRDDQAQMALVTRGRDRRIVAERLDDVGPGEVRPAPGAPFSWAASKSKYWLIALVSAPAGPGIGGVVMRGAPEPDAAELQVTLQVPAGSSGIEFIAYAGPQDFARLQAVGQELHNVNPYGYRWLRWFLRPFGNLIVVVLIWMHENFSLAYGWVLIVFGIASRIVLLPLYQISTRQQMKQMAIQPQMKRVQERHKGDPQRLREEQMKLYREHGVNPLGGCLPMLLPLPILLTLFFVFQNTIEFRGVPFLWLPDLSLRDPLFVIPALMGGSMLLLNWITQRSMETNAQMKMFSYALPAVFTVFFAFFPAGLNLYYTASNIASLPQTLYLSRERRKRQPPGTGGGPRGKPTPDRGGKAQDE